MVTLAMKKMWIRGELFVYTLNTHIINTHFHSIPLKSPSSMRGGGGGEKGTEQKQIYCPWLISKCFILN